MTHPVTAISTNFCESLLKNCRKMQDSLIFCRYTNSYITTSRSDGDFRSLSWGGETVPPPTDCPLGSPLRYVNTLCKFNGGGCCCCSCSGRSVSQKSAQHRGTGVIRSNGRRRLQWRSALRGGQTDRQTMPRGRQPCRSTTLTTIITYVFLFRMQQQLRDRISSTGLRVPFLEPMKTTTNRTAWWKMLPMLRGYFNRLCAAVRSKT